MDAAEIQRRIDAHRCVVCGREIDDWATGKYSGDGFPFTECRDHRGKHFGRKPEHFDHKKEQAEGLENLRRLGAIR